MTNFKEIVYTEDEEQVEELFQTFIANYGQKYPNLRSYVESLFKIKERWCMCYRKDLHLRGNNTNNYVEAQFLVLKDNVLNRTKEVCFR